jgi:hypothetical protein
MRLSFFGIGVCVGLLIGLSDSPVIGAAISAIFAFIPAVYRRFSSDIPVAPKDDFLRQTFGLVLILVLGLTCGAVGGLQLRSNNVLVQQGIVRDYNALLSLGATPEMALEIVGTAYTQGRVTPDVTLRSGVVPIDETQKALFHNSLQVLIRQLDFELSKPEQQDNIALLSARESSLKLFEILKSMLSSDLSTEAELLWFDYFFLREDQEEEWVNSLTPQQRRVFDEVLFVIE